MCFSVSTVATTRCYALSLHDALPIFMTIHRINLAHAQDVVSRLLEAVIDGAPSPLKLAKLEGDAAFFYAPVSSESEDRKSTRLNSSHLVISYAVFCLKKKKNERPKL